MTTFVTAFLDLREDRSNDKSIETCFSHFLKLLTSEINIVVFLSKTFANRIEKKPNIHIIYIELEELEVYKKLSSDINLPKNRTPHHDTKNFLTLMNSKIEFVKRAIDINRFRTNQFAWIDFSINHVFKNTENSLKFLQLLNKSELKSPVLLFPGCWPKEVQSSAYDSVHWRFCGGFFIGDQISLIHFYNLFMDSFQQIFENSLTWEVNVWHILESKFGWNPTWYKADHNDSIIRIPTSFLKVVVSFTTIPSRIETCRATIDSLYNQVDRIYLNIPYFYKRFNTVLRIPTYLTEEPYKSKVELVICEDKGPATKYLGAIEKIPNNVHIFFCDDDQEYANNLIERMLNSVNSLSVVQNRYNTIKFQTSGGFIHGYVGNMVNSNLVQDLVNFPLPECAYHVDDQWMSIYYFYKKIDIRETGLESYRDIYKSLENNHEKIGADSLANLGTRDAKVNELANYFNVEFGKEGTIKEKIEISCP